LKIQNDRMHFEKLNSINRNLIKDHNQIKNNNTIGWGSSVNVTISDEGKKEVSGSLLMEREKDESMLNQTNEVSFEHYMNMNKLIAEKLQNISRDKQYDIEDMMSATMDAYEECYNTVIQAHKNGDRKVNYEISGKCSITLEKDLQGLNEAFEKKLEDMRVSMQAKNVKLSTEGLADWLKRRGYSDPEIKEHLHKANYKTDEMYTDQFRENIIQIMKKAQDNFILRHNRI